MKVGDLVCYNAAGQRYKTLGVVYEFGTSLHGYSRRGCVLIQWCIVGEIMPRREWHNQGWSRDPIQPGEFIWHPIGDWFEVANENR
tara:strand:+ start:4393 stop:4650 length:258 start_codon:yes stop_codon:yes gene_type:complete